jgi:hypothetical protein
MENTLFDQISLCTIFIYIQNLYSGNKISIIYENNILSVVHYHEIIVIEVKNITTNTCKMNQLRPKEISYPRKEN